MKKTVFVMFVLCVVVGLTSCAQPDETPIRNGSNEIVSLSFPDESTETAPWYSIGTDAGWNWKFKDLSAKEIPSLFGQKDELLFEGSAVDGMIDLTAEGYFDTGKVAQSMMVQGWREETPVDVPNHPIFQINMFRLDSKLMRSKVGEDAIVDETEVFCVPVITCWREIKNADCYYATFETNGLAVSCTTYTSSSQSNEGAKALLSRIVSQCLDPNGGIELK